MTVRLHHLAVAALAVSMTACDADDDSDAAGDTTAALTVATSNQPSTTSTAATVPATVPPTSAVDTADRFDDLPTDDPVTVVRRPGVLWPMDPNIGVASRYKPFSASEEQHGSETVRTVTYVHDDCTFRTAEQTDLPGCEPAIIVEARFGASPEPNETTPRVPITDDGGLWAYESNEPDGIPQCFQGMTPEAPFVEAYCGPPVTLERPIGDVAISVTSEVPEEVYSLLNPQWSGESLAAIALRLQLVDEAVTTPSDPYSQPLDPLTDFPWFQGEPFGQVVAVTDDDRHELRVQNDGTDIAFWATGTDATPGYILPPYQETADSLVALGWNRWRGTAVVFGMTDPSIFELVFETTDGELIPVPTGDLTGIFHHQFFIAAMPWRTTLSDSSRSGVVVSARDADGNEVGRYAAQSCCGVWSIDEDGNVVVEDD